MATSSDHPHSNGQVIAHDRDAIIRTTLANQRTFLAYIRTALTLFVAGVTFVRFFDILVVEIIGWAFIPLGIATFFVGLWRYNVLRLRMKRAGKLPG